MARPAGSSARRDEVLDTALHLFAEHGYDQTSTARIEEVLGMRPGAGGLFRHVGSKKELLEAAVERAMERRFEPPPGPFRSPAHTLVTSVLHLVDADPDLWRLILRDAARLPLDVHALYLRLAQPAFDQAVEFGHAWFAGTADEIAERVIVGISALLYLRVCQWTYDLSPAGLDEAAFTAVVERLFTGGDHA